MEEPRKSPISDQESPGQSEHHLVSARDSNRLLLSILERIAQGDLNLRVTDYSPECALHDLPLLSSLDEMVRRLSHIVGRLRRAADSIDTVVGEVLRGTQALSSGVIDEAKSVEEASTAITGINQSAASVIRNLNVLSTLSQSTSTSIGQMVSSIDLVSQNADELAQFVEETRTAIEQMGITVRKVADSAQFMSDSADKTVQAMTAIDSSTNKIGQSVNETTLIAEEVALSADSGSRLVAETAKSVSKIKEAIDAARETIGRLGKRSDQIGELTHVINEIADRTNLLALNASILAAQAGSHGRGFRIVADEIKELSERTSASTREIEETIKSIREDVSETIERVTVGSARADEGVNLASRAADMLNDIKEKTSASSERIKQIADATAVQAAESHTVLEAADLVSKQARDIHYATGEQAETSSKIGERAQYMSELTEKVQRRAGEQAQVTRYIAEAMEDLTRVVEQIQNASGEQAVRTEHVSRAAEIIREVIALNETSISGINSAVDILVREAELLDSEVESFQLPAPERGGHLRFALRASQIVLDPGAVSSISQFGVMSNIFEGLVQFGERAEIRPAVAERWDISPDGRVYTFHLRESARFHNGRRIKSDDIRTSFERQMRKNTDASAWVFRPIEGAEEYMSGEAGSVSGFEVSNDQTIRLILIKPVAFFLSTLCTEFAYIVPVEEIERPASDFEIKPVGSGPFRVVEPVLAKEIQLERFSNYWDPELPRVDRLTITFGRSGDDIKDSFLRGELDYVSDLPLTDLTDLTHHPGEAHVMEAVQLQTRMLVFDCERPPFSDRRVRQAINYALNRDRFLQDVYGGMAEAAIGPIPPGLLGYDAGERGYKHDPARARKLLAEAGYADGFDTEVWWSDRVNPAVECLKEDLAEACIRAEFRYVGATDLLRALKTRMVPITGRDWYADYPDPDNFTYVLFNSRNKILLTDTYFNEEVDRITEQARAEMNREKRADLYREVTRILLEDSPCAFLAHRRGFVAHRAGLEGVTLHLLPPFITPKDLWFRK